MRTKPISYSYGIAVPFKENVIEGGENVADNLYKVHLCHIVSGNDNVEYKPVWHVFTEKELQRAATRYYTECSNLDHVPFTKGQSVAAARGYVGVRTYVNKNGDLTTRFVIRFEASKVSGLGNEICIGLFTHREMKRSTDRFAWFKINKMSWFGKLLAKLFPKYVTYSKD